MKLSSQDNVLLSQFGITDVNHDDNITVGEQTEPNKSVAEQIARTSSKGSASEIDSDDVALIRHALDANAVIKASLSSGKADQAIKMTSLFLAQIDEYENILDAKATQYATEHPYLTYVSSAPVKNIYDLSLSSDASDQWMAHTILSITAYLWPDVTRDNCEGLYTQEVCDASKAIAANTKNISGDPYTRPVDIGSTVVLPQLRTSLLNRVLND